MAPARPLRDVFTELAGSAAGTGAGAESAGADPERLLAAAGHPDLPAGLVAEAVVSYADTAPVEVAEHLAPFVVAHSPVPVDPDDPAAPEPESWLEVLASAPDVLAADPAGGDLDIDAGAVPVADEVASGADAGPDQDPFALDFGGGAAESGDGAGLDHDPTGLDHVGFGSGAGRVDPAAGPGDAADSGVAGHPYVDDLVALDGLDAAGGLAAADDLDNAGDLDRSASLDGSAGVGGSASFDAREPVAGHHDHHGADSSTVDGEPTGGE